MKPFLLLILFCFSAHADEDFWRGLNATTGAGFGYQQMEITQGSTSAKYPGGKWTIDLGLIYNWTPRVSSLLMAEYGRMEGTNGVGSNSFLEHLSDQFYSAKIGGFVGQLGMGVGMRVHSFSIESVSISNGALKESFEANTLFGFLAATLRQRTYQITLEGQYHTGKKDSRSITDVDLTLKCLLAF